ncbi:four helix bundle protein [Candidatus Nitrospira bockiana]
MDVWKNAHSMVLDTYRFADQFPETEKFRLTTQLCRAAVSVPANIVEGSARQSTKEYLHFLATARASLEETRYFVLLAKDLGYLQENDYDDLELKMATVSRLLNGLIRSLRKKRTGLLITHNP